MRRVAAGGPRLRVVAIGGGTGLPVVLRGFKQLLFPDGADDPSRLVAIVTVTDDGGSSGRLRDELGMLPPGDIRNCMVALSHNEPLMSRLFQARYRSNGSLDGHSVGNLILAALAQEEPDGFLAAVRLAGEVLNIQGRVLPATLAPTRLVATLEDGREIAGETAIKRGDGAIRSLRLDPPAPPAAPGAADAVLDADIVVLGPGSLYSSILPNLLIPEIAEALRRTRACRVLVVNAMTERGETTRFGASEHVQAITSHVGAPVIDAALVASDPIPEDTLERYRAEGAERVDPNDPGLDMLVPVVDRRLLLAGGRKVRHAPARTATAVVAAYGRWTAAGRPRGAGVRAERPRR
ncbi:MAG: uridine diphosphate-N-acetylglucosamine-binding protein YvcK [Acidobacteria bacterium]|nr:MAG: uridine diphosphate-N-acetylglucosamine-binding protein YvcK [Acidobacteriota bacterium]